MAEPLKNRYGPEIPRRIAGDVARVHPSFPARAFLGEALDGYDALELMPRGRQIARALAAHLPREFAEAARILVASLGPPLEASGGNGMSPFLYMPHAFFVAERGLEHFEASMAAQHAITQRFTAEFSIRAFLERHPDRTLARLAQWSRDPSAHVRRLVSEGTRPRLPWAPRLRELQRDPRPVLALLELLKDDPELYVRRSVANNLNDIGKDHPGLVIEVAARWLADAGSERRWIVAHALRSAIKRGDTAAFEVLGFRPDARIEVVAGILAPRRPMVGGAVGVSFEVVNASSRRQRAVVDFRIGYVKANGRAAFKVFKMRTLELGPRECLRLAKRVSLADMTTRRHYPGSHEVQALVNGQPWPLGAFVLRRP